MLKRIEKLEREKAEKSEISRLDQQKADKTEITRLDTFKADKSELDSLSARLTSHQGHFDRLVIRVEKLEELVATLQRSVQELRSMKTTVQSNTVAFHEAKDSMSPDDLAAMRDLQQKVAML